MWILDTVGRTCGGNDSNGIDERKSVVNVVTNWRISMVEILETNDCSEQYTKYKMLLVEKGACRRC